jgi:hypothetical protein
MNEVHAREFQRYKISWDDYLKQYFIGHDSAGGIQFSACSLKDTIVPWLNPKPTTHQQREPDTVDFTGYLPDAR